MPLRRIAVDFSKQKADVMVLPVTISGELYSGASERFAKTVGENLIRNEIKKAGLKQGEISVISGFGFCRAIVLACFTPIMSEDKHHIHSLRKFIRQCCIKTLDWACDNKAESVCFPLVGNAQFSGFTGSIMSKVINTYLMYTECNIDVSITDPVFDDDNSVKNGTGEFKVVTGDILDYPCDAVVISSEAYSPSERRVLLAAGIDNCSDIMQQLSDCSFGNILIENQTTLKSKYLVIGKLPKSYEVDKCVFPPARSYIRRVCFNAIDFACSAKLGSIAFLLMGEYINEKAESVMIQAIRSRLEFHASLMDVVLVKPLRRVPVFVGNDALSSETEKGSSPDISGVFSRYDREFENSVKASGLESSDYCRKRLTEILNLHIESLEKLALEINYDKSSISKLRSGRIRKPQKHRVIALAIGMKLSDKERYEFIRCANYQYPADERDRLVESLIRGGVTDFDEINTRLISADPQYSLDKNIRQAPNQKKGIK